MAAAKDGNGKLSASEAAAQEAMTAYARWVEIVDESDRRGVGSWYDIPHGFTDWHFVRCGRRNTAAAETLAATLRRAGYVPAPKPVKCTMFESDGEDGLYLCAPPAVYAGIREIRARKRVSVERRALESMGMLGELGDRVTVRGQSGRGSLEELREAESVTIGRG